MRFSASLDRYYPTLEQKLLLQASLNQGEQAISAWQQWRDAVDIENLDSESHHLLSLLYQNLALHNVEDEHMARLKGVYRRTWYANQLLFKAARSVLQALQERQVEAIALQDVAFIQYYRDGMERPVYSLDFLVLPNQAETAIQVLASLGWTPASTHSHEPLLSQSVIEFQDQTRQRLYLHQHIFWAIPQDYTDQQVWSDKVSSEMSHFSIHILNPTDQLLFICSRSKHRNERHQLRWLVDAWMLLQSSGEEVDWGKLVAQAQRYRLVLPLKNLLILLQDVLDVIIPNWILSTLDRIPISNFELLEHQIFPGYKKLQFKADLIRVYCYFSNLKNSVVRSFSMNSLSSRIPQPYESKSI